MNDKNALSQMISELMESHGTNPEKLAAATNIPVRFITSIKNAEFSRLPPDPYVRGYLIKIAHTLKADQTEILKVYRESAEASRAGAKDKLPENHFRKMIIGKGWLIGIAVAALAASFVFFRFDEILGLSTLQVEVPETTNSKVFKVVGSVHPGEQLTLNGEIVYTNGTGRFEKDIILEPGLNKLEFVVKKFLGRETKIIKEIYYEVLPEPAPDSTGSTSSPRAAPVTPQTAPASTQPAPASPQPQY